MYVNAGIKSKKELAQRLINGKVFYTKYDSPVTPIKLFFDEKEVYPFRAGDLGMDLEWLHPEHILKAFQWWENIPEKGVLCWVSSESSESRLYSGLVVRNDLENGKFHTLDGRQWNYATPIKPEECLQEDY